MQTRTLKLIAVALAALFLTSTAFEPDAWARAGGSKSSGSRGSRTMSTPKRPDATQPSRPSAEQQKSQTAVTPPASMPQPSFGRSLLTAIAGGFIGSLIFGGLAHAMGGLGGFGGSGFGLIEILLIGGLLFFLFRMFRKKKQEEYAYQRRSYEPARQGSPVQDIPPVSAAPAYEPNEAEQGMSHIRTLDASFDEARFKEFATQTFFKIQGAWAGRDLATMGDLLTDEMRRIFQSDIEDLKSRKQINRLENIAMRNIAVGEAWQEGGQDYITVLFTANLLDYTVDETTGGVIAGSKADPVFFEEYWTFTRPVGNNVWKLSAISQT
ncbi:MAG TPA: Tim44 domain-containing protein [Dissulfurispiraceae bacterium]|nr:Tim44 domain-containing protein [Dissulfurispiraceae bacterium]